MKFWKFVSNVRHYKTQVFLSIVCNVLMAIFMVVNIPLFIPLLETLFQTDTSPVIKPEAVISVGNFISYVKFWFYNAIESYSRQQAIGFVCVAIVISFFLNNLFRYLAMYFIAPVRTGIIRDLRGKMYDKILDLPLSFFSRERKGDIISRVTSDVLEVEWSILNVIEKVFREPLIFLGSLLFMLYISVQLTLFVFVLILFMGVVIGGISRTLKKSSKKVQDSLGNVIAILEESLGGLRVIKAFGSKDYMRDMFQNQNNLSRNLLTGVLRRRDLSSPLSEFLGVSVVALLIWFGADLVFTGEIKAGTFFAFLFAFYNVINPAKAFSSAYYSIQKGMAALDRIDMILDQDIERDFISNAPSVAFQKNIRFDNVSFRYKNETAYVLNNIDLEILKGQTVALVGASGVGKSTLVDLLLRFYHVSEGTISLDGVDINEMNLTDLRSKSALVTQQPILFNDTVFNNIVFSNKNFTMDQVVNAAKTANAHDFIIEMPEGYQAVIGDGGMNLSGGQRQRLTIARAILRDPQILILDEATSSLDAESEKLVQDALLKVMNNRTAIVIAHRLSTIKNADKIVVMKEGRIVQLGTHDELIRSTGEYQKFVDLQSL